MWRKPNVSFAVLLSLNFLYNQLRYETFLQGEQNMNQAFSLPLSADSRDFPEKSALFSGALWYN